MGWVYAVLPVTGLLMALVSLHRLAGLLRGSPAAPGGLRAAADATE
jgi:TRAP-type C4-dicarboxylate transport system permease small subunit